MNKQLTVAANVASIRSELNLIGANARGLKGLGRELLPLKPDMLGLPPAEAAIVMDAVELLFAAILQYVDSQLAERAGTDQQDSIAIVKARIDNGQADGTIRALLHGPTKTLLQVACEHAPIAMHSIISVCPELNLRDRLLLNRPENRFR